jgi:hypothetical protein
MNFSVVVYVLTHPRDNSNNNNNKNIDRAREIAVVRNENNVKVYPLIVYT